MFPVWHNMDSFKRHVEDMKNFRQSHNNRPTEVSKITNDMPELFDVKPPRETGLIKSLNNDKGRLIFVPIWKISLPRGARN
jgi:hypothetical protein